MWTKCNVYLTFGSLYGYYVGMIERPYWQQKVLHAWKRRPIVWLSGVRRAGKTVLARMLPRVVYLNCDLPAVVRRLEDCESFFRSQDQGAWLVLDEVHRLMDPSLVLKVAADAFPHLRVLATGSSTLAATRKFRDTLTGRKETIYLPPVLWSECVGPFQVSDLDRRLLHGGLPEALLSPTKDETFFAEWIDSYYARDIAELFSVRNRSGFLALLRLLLHQSGGMADISKLSSECGLSRATVTSHIDAMAVAHAVFPVRPFHGGSRRELVHRPKLYAFDTGFVTHARGWTSLREEDRGVLWEHLVLDTLRAVLSSGDIRYWRDKTGREVDFVLPGPSGIVDAIECKISPARFDVTGLRAFRALYPLGRNWLVCPYEQEPWQRSWGTIAVDVVNANDLVRAIEPRAVQEPEP